MESMLAVYGSGAARRSYDGRSRILNIDIGGGTSKLGLVQNGELQATAAVHVGGRLLVVDETGRITRLDPAGRAHALRAGFDWQVGSMTQPQQLTQVAESMADALLRIVKAQYIESDVQELLLTDPLPGIEQLDGVMFSGGVGEYVYGARAARFRRPGQAPGRGDPRPARCRCACPGSYWKPASASAPPCSAPPSTACN